MKKRVPAMRFKGFGGDWVEKKFSDIVSRISILSKRVDYPRIEYEDIQNEIGLLNKDVFKKRSNKSGLLFSKNDLLYGKLRPYLKNWYLAKFPGIAVGDFWVLRQNNSDIDFIYFLIQTELFQLSVNQSTGTKMPRADWQLVANCFYKTPSIPEQEKIGSFFQELDRLLALKQRKLESLQKLKAAMLSRLFPVGKARRPELRFEGFGGDWEERRLGEVGEIIGGGTPSTQNKEYWDGAIDWYSPTEIGDNVYEEGSVKKITDAGLKNSSARLLPAGKTVLFTSRASIGDMAILKKAGATNQGFQSIVLNENHNPYFIYSMGFMIKKYAIKNASGSTFLEISGKALSNMPVKCPSLAEQEKIGAFFRGLDELIGLESRSIRKLQGVKKGLLGGMFV